MSSVAGIFSKELFELYEHKGTRHVAAKLFYVSTFLLDQKEINLTCCNLQFFFVNV